MSSENLRFAIVTCSDTRSMKEDTAGAALEALIAAGAVPVGLGPRILRCETAPLAGLAACMCLWGQLE